MKNENDLTERLMRVNMLLHRFNGAGMHRGGDPRRGQGRVLSILKLKPQLSQKELGYLLDMRNQSLGELLQKLEKKGYITRTPSEQDKRTMDISLTEEGREAAEQAEQGASGMDAAFECLSDEERQQLNGLLQRVEKQLMEAMDIPEKKMEALFEMRMGHGHHDMMGHGHGHGGRHGQRPRHPGRPDMPPHMWEGDSGEATGAED